MAWTLFFEKPTIPERHGGRLIPFINWLWDELGKRKLPMSFYQYADRQLSRGRKP